MAAAPAVLALVLVAGPAALAAKPASDAAVRAAAAAAARALAQPAPHFRNLARRGDVVCGEIGAKAAGYRPFFAYPRAPGWAVHASKDGLAVRHGLQCFDRETAAPRPGAKTGGACAGYDFDFYFAYDHFCR